MNFCTKCRSIYAQPGTCNCFARTAPAPQVVPFPYQPVQPNTFPWVAPPIGPTITYSTDGANSTSGATTTNVVRYPGGYPPGTMTFRATGIGQMVE
jgi:hypothetical protein